MKLTGLKMKRGQRRVVAFWWAAIFVFVALGATRAWTQSTRTAPPPSSGELTLNLDPVQSKLHWTLGSTLHTVHGTFALKRGVAQVSLSIGRTSFSAGISARGRSHRYARSGRVALLIAGSLFAPCRSFPVQSPPPDRLSGKMCSDFSDPTECTAR